MGTKQVEVMAVEPATDTARPIWQKPGLAEVTIDEVTGCCYLNPAGNDGSQYVTSVL